jgi:hypothetical protein
MTTSSTPGPRSRGVKYKVGDRVMHKPALATLTAMLPERQKHGTIISAVFKTNKNGAKMPYVQVKWDDSQIPEWHMTMRIKHIDG